jgi:hypothetical protein
MSDTKHISEIIDSIGNQQAELKKIFGENPPITSSKDSAEQSYLRTIRYWMDKVSEAQYHIRKNQKKIEDLYEQP